MSPFRNVAVKFRLAAAVIASTLVAGVAPAGAQIPPIPPGWQMERVVLLARHGVRAPVQSAEDLARFAASPWPAWPVAPGDLTPRGEELMKLMGAFFRLHFGGTGLIEEAICPPSGAVVIWADADKHTVFTATSALKGAYPRCGTAVVKHQTDLSRPDPLFHPPRSASCPMDAARDRAAVLARIGGDFSSVLSEYAPQLKTVQAVLCPPGLSPAGGACGLAVEAPAIVANADGGVAMKGPIAIAAMASEIFLLESAEGMPADQVAWGRLQGDAALRDVLKTHRLLLDLMEKTRPIARQKGSNMLAQIVASLQDGHKFPGALPVAEPVRFGVLIGRDSNIANVAGLLNLEWEIPGYQTNEVPPGSSLAFELLRDVGTGQRYVRMAYFAQTPEQMRQATRLDLDHLPGMAAVDLPACSAQARNRACPVERFVEIATAAIDPGCVTIGK